MCLLLRTLQCWCSDGDASVLKRLTNKITLAAQQRRFRLATCMLNYQAVGSWNVKLCVSAAEHSRPAKYTIGYRIELLNENCCCGTHVSFHFSFRGSHMKIHRMHLPAPRRRYIIRRTIMRSVYARRYEECQCKR